MRQPRRLLPPAALNSAAAVRQRKPLGGYGVGLGVFLGALAAGLTGCADTAPTAPAAAPRAPSLATTTTTSTTSTTTGTAVTTLNWTKAVTATTISAAIGPAGGSLAIAGGVKLTVPANAVPTTVTFSITRLAGTIVAYDFQPHGMRFAVPLLVEQPTAGTDVSRWAAASLQGAYFSNNAGLNQAAGTAHAAEFEPTTIASDKSWIRFQVPHFSGYMMSSGRK